MGWESGGHERVGCERGKRKVGCESGVSEKVIGCERGKGKVGLRREEGRMGVNVGVRRGVGGRVSGMCERESRVEEGERVWGVRGRECGCERMGWERDSVGRERVGCVRGIERVGLGKVWCEREWGVREGKGVWD